MQTSLKARVTRGVSGASLALGNYFAERRLLAPGDVFAVVAETPADGGGCLRIRGEGTSAQTPSGGGGGGGGNNNTRRVFYFVVHAMSAVSASGGGRGGGGGGGGGKRGGEVSVMEVSRDWTACTLLGAAAAGGPPPGGAVISHDAYPQNVKIFLQR